MMMVMCLLITRIIVLSLFNHLRHVTCIHADIDPSHVRIEVKERIKHQSGALVELLIFVYSLEVSIIIILSSTYVVLQYDLITLIVPLLYYNLQDWQHINITDIKILSSECREHRDVVLKFQSDVAQEWKNKFDSEKYNKCESIVQSEAN